MRSESFQTARYRLEIECDDRVQRITLTDSYSGVAIADGDYRYSAVVECDGKILILDGLASPRVEEKVLDRGGRVVVISGRLGVEVEQAIIQVEHRFHLSEDEDCLEERIVLRNAREKAVSILSYRFGFRKRLASSKKYGGPGIDIENYRVVAVPFRIQPNGQKHDYQLDDLFNARYQCAVTGYAHHYQAPVIDGGRARSEGWALTDGEYGLLVQKYNPDMIEYSMLETERVGDETFLNFGGAAPSLYGEPSQARGLEGAGELAFGKTRYHFYEGLWRRAYIIFKSYLTSLGNGLPDNYDPPVTWSVARTETQDMTLEQVEAEAEQARDIGCGAISFGSEWETSKGDATWDTERLGDACHLITRLKTEFGLMVNINISGRCARDSFPGMYRRDYSGNTGYHLPYQDQPFYEPCVSFKKFQIELGKRIAQVLECGADYATFREFDWRGPCFETTHGHAVPSTAALHAEAVVDAQCSLRERFPNVKTKMDDPVWPSGVRYLPPYFLYDEGSSFTAVTAFGFSSNPLEELLSGKALSLFYYNLAYDLPLTVRLDMIKDNDNCLAFWWYASTVRHLGICAGRFDQKRYDQYAQALREYLPIKRLYTHGVVYAVDELTHVHVLPDEAECVVDAFNLTDTPLYREVTLRPSEFGVLDELCVESKDHCVIGGKIVLNLDMLPFSHTQVRLKAAQ